MKARRLLGVGLLAGLMSAGRAAAPGDVAFEQRIGAQLPLGTVLTDASGRSRTLGEYLGGKPAVLIFNYFRCPQMCSLVASGAIDSLRTLKLSAGADYEVLTVSIDPTDTPAAALVQQNQDLGRYGRPGAAAGWHTLVGAADQVGALAAAAGFRYHYDPRSRQYAHPSGILVVSPRGVVSQYYLGVDFAAPDLAAALRTAAANRTGDSVFSLLFVCFQGGAEQGQYTRIIWIVLWASVLATLAGVFGGILWMLGQERRRSRGGAS
jgi:protein SCO1/2